MKTTKATLKKMEKVDLVSFTSHELKSLSPRFKKWLHKEVCQTKKCVCGLRVKKR